MNIAQHLPRDQGSNQAVPKLRVPRVSRQLQGSDTRVPVVGRGWSHPSHPCTRDPEPRSSQSPGRGSATRFPSETPKYFSLRHNKSQPPWEPAVQRQFIETNNSSCNPCFEQLTSDIIVLGWEVSHLQTKHAVCLCFVLTRHSDICHFTVWCCMIWHDAFEMQKTHHHHLVRPHVLLLAY